MKMFCAGCHRLGPSERVDEQGEKYLEVTDFRACPNCGGHTWKSEMDSEGG